MDAHLLAPTTQRTAVTIARLIARVNRVQLIVQGWSGRIQRRGSHGHDPVESRG